MFSIRRKLIATSAVIAVVVSMAAIALAQMPIIPYPEATASYPSGLTTRSLSADQRASLIAELEAAKQHDRRARAGWSQEPTVQSDYDEKVMQINRILTGLQNGDDYRMSDVSSAMASPGTAPY